jgi:hypothetical protein
MADDKEIPPLRDPLKSTTAGDKTPKPTTETVRDPLKIITRDGDGGQKK